jgi:hypothetical protein
MTLVPRSRTHRAPSSRRITADDVEGTSGHDTRDDEHPPRPRPRKPRSVRIANSEVSTWDPTWDIVDEWGAQSFPASDPPANW